MRATSSPGYRWVVLAMAFFGVFGAMGFGRFGYSAILPSMQEALNLTSAAAGSLNSWNLAGYTVMAGVGGVLASRFGPRLVLTAGMTATALGMLLTGTSDGFAGASAARLLTGLGNGMVLVPSIALMAAWFHGHQVGFASSIVPTGGSLAMVLTGPFVPRLIAAGGEDGWRSAWYFFAAVTIVLTVLNFLIQRDRPARPVRAFEAAHKSRVRGNGTGGADVSRRAGGSDFMSIMRSGYVWYLGLIYFLYGVGFMTYLTFFQKRLTADVGYSPETAGNLFLVIGVAGLVGGLLWGTVSDRIGRRWTIIITMVLAGAAGLLFAWAPGKGALGVSAALLGSTGPIIPGLVGAACGDRFGAMLASASLGFVTMLCGVGMAIGPYVGGLLEDVLGSLGPAYLMSAAAFVVGGVGATVLWGPSRVTHPRNL
jgi:sugar phosphate permease